MQQAAGRLGGNAARPVRLVHASSRSILAKLLTGPCAYHFFLVHRPTLRWPITRCAPMTAHTAPCCLPPALARRPTLQWPLPPSPSPLATGGQNFNLGCSIPPRQLHLVGTPPHNQERNCSRRVQRTCSIHRMILESRGGWSIKEPKRGL